MQSHCRLTRAHERDPLRCRQADKTWGVQQNKTVAPFSSLLFSSYPSFLPTYLPTYLPHPFFLTCLPIYLPTFIFSYLPTLYFG
jgi:hypothetical protein